MTATSGKRSKKARREARNKLRAATNPKRTVTGTVSSPTVPGAVERLEMVIDTVWSMRRRRQIDEASWLAAETYREAYDRIGARLGGCMDFDRVRGGGQGAGYSDAELWAAETIREADRLLGKTDGLVVELVVGCNWNIGETTRTLQGPDAKTDRAARRDCEIVGERLRVGLKTLARAWHPRPRSGLRTWRAEDAASSVGASGVREIELAATPARRR